MRLGDASIDTRIGDHDLSHAAAALITPFGFIRRLDADGERSLFLEGLTRPLPSAEDLRFVHAPPAGSSGVVVFARTLAWDSTFFGYGVAKIDAIVPLHAAPTVPDFGPAVAALLERAAAKDVTYLFAAVDARDIHVLRALGDAGFALIESRVCYHHALEDFEPERRYAVRSATAADIPSLGCAARDTVNPYDRFHADPFIARADADRLMYTWVEASIVDGFADITIVPDVPEPAAFCTVRYHRDKWERWGLRLAQLAFSAVSPAFKGWHVKLVSEADQHLKSVGVEHTYMVTQATNLPVIRTCESLGYRYGKTEHILRKIISRA